MREFDCAVVGAGPAGLTAALYLARFRRSVILFDGGRSRAQWISQSNNFPGFPDGVSGDELLQLLRTQLARYDVTIRPRRIRRLVKNASYHLFDEADKEVRARCVLLATGYVDTLPDVDWCAAAIDASAMRLCPVCDGFEATDRRIGIWGPMETCLEHAVFLRTYSRDVTILSSSGPPSDDDASRADAAGIAVVQYVDARFDGKRCAFVTRDGNTHCFDIVYPFMGGVPTAHLAASIGADLDENGSIRVDSDQMTSISGLYAAGDVVDSLHQIAVAAAHSATAATAMHAALQTNFREAESLDVPDRRDTAARQS